METGKTCKFDILFTKSVPHIQETIFFSLDYESYKDCLGVSTTWYKLLASESYLKKAKSVFHGEIGHEERKLWQAAKEGNVEEVQRLSSIIFMDVNSVWGRDQSTALCEAVQNASSPQNHSRYTSQKNVIELLLAKGADPDLIATSKIVLMDW